MDAYSVEIGTGNLTSVYQLSAQQFWNTGYPWLTENHVAPYWEISVAAMEGRKFNDIAGQRQSLIGFGFTPVLRWQSDGKSGGYAEIGIGINYLTEKYNNNNRTMGGDFQFGDYIGCGYVFSSQVDVSVKFKHYSDAGIEHPNPAVNFVMLKLSYPF